MKEWESKKRTHNLNELGIEDVGKEVVLMGWVLRRRDHGGVIFIDLRDREGLTQVVFDPSHNETSHEGADHVRNEYVIFVTGKVRPRPEGMANPNLATGEIEVICDFIEIVNKSEPIPFQIEDGLDTSEAVRLKYRYLDLRRPEIQRNFKIRHKACIATRTFLDAQTFLEIETPMLTRSTPEGARDYLVPSRTNPGKFFALPQSPQLFKQLLMVSGFERYFQIVKCFRDEDLRADRQPEFTQIDMEMSFVTEEDVMSVTEGLLSAIFKHTIDKDIEVPFPRMTYDEAIARYGLDKPDTRFGLELTTITDIFENSDFQVFARAIKSGGIVKAMKHDQGTEFSRKDIDELTKYVGLYGAKGLAWIKVGEDGKWQSPIIKFMSDAEKDGMKERLDMQPGDIVFFSADSPQIVNDSLGHLRLKIGEMHGLIPEDKFNFLWVTEFPLLEYDPIEKRYTAMHHPFTSPRSEDMDKLADDAASVKARSYDVVLNGIEIGGGSIRIHEREMQNKVFQAIGMKDEEIENKFGFLLEAFRYGAPPHGGIAFGLDRLCMLISGRDSIRDVIAFPKTQSATCLLTDAPTAVENKQLNELFIKLNVPEEK